MPPDSSGFRGNLVNSNTGCTVGHPREGEHTVLVTLISPSAIVPVPALVTLIFAAPSEQEEAPPITTTFPVAPEKTDIMNPYASPTTATAITTSIIIAITGVIPLMFILCPPWIKSKFLSLQKQKTKKSYLSLAVSSCWM